MKQTRFYVKNKQTGKFLSVRVVIFGNKLYDEVVSKYDASQHYYKEDAERAIKEQPNPEKYEILELPTD